MVINLAIDRQRNTLILVRKWLRAAVHTNDTQTLMRKNLYISAIYPTTLLGELTRVVANITTAPIRSSVSVDVDVRT